MSETSADAGVVMSRVQLERLVAEDELTGRTIAGFQAASVGMRGADLDNVVIERLGLGDADAEGARLEHAELRQVDGRRSKWGGALWHRVRAKDSDFTEIDLTGAQLLRCELGPLRMPRARFHQARIQGSTFTQAELYSSDFRGAVLTKVVFDGYDGATVSLSRCDFTGAALVEVEFRRANMYGAVFANAVLIRCDLRGVNLCSADLRGARLVGCITDGADLDGAQL
jgi:uncharacterized protein YjbI with pentapeptide repeats